MGDEIRQDVFWGGVGWGGGGGLKQLEEEGKWAEPGLSHHCVLDTVAEGRCKTESGSTPPPPQNPPAGLLD